MPYTAYAIAIVSTSQITLQATIAHHGIVRNNPNSGTYFNKTFSSTTHCCYIKHSSHHHAPTFADLVGEFFRVLELEFLVKSFEKIL
jgi:hypothetical protein